MQDRLRSNLPWANRAPGISLATGNFATLRQTPRVDVKPFRSDAVRHSLRDPHFGVEARVLGSTNRAQERSSASEPVHQVVIVSGRIAGNVWQLNRTATKSDGLTQLGDLPTRLHTTSQLPERCQVEDVLGVCFGTCAEVEKTIEVALRQLDHVHDHQLVTSIRHPRPLWWQCSTRVSEVALSKEEGELRFYALDGHRSDATEGTRRQPLVSRVLIAIDQIVLPEPGRRWSEVTDGLGSRRNKAREFGSAMLRTPRSRANGRACPRRCGARSCLASRRW